MQTKSIPSEVLARMFSPRFTNRFWSKVDRRSPDECWPWTKSIRAGYGTVNIWRFGGRQVHISTHRVAWVLSNGKDIPEGQWVLHTCVGNKRCCNPRHLKLGTHDDNMRDMANSGANKGERNGGCKLTAEQVIEIRRLHSQRSLTHKAIADLFGINKKYVWKITSRGSWNHV